MAILTEEEREVDAYAVLGIESGASENEVRRAYRKKSLKCHPDKNPGEDAAAMFRLISVAQAILLNPEKRKFVDTKLEQTRAAAARRAEMDAKRKVKVDDLLRREEEAKRARKDAMAAKKAAADEEAVREAGRQLLEEARKKREEAAAAAAKVKASAAKASAAADATSRSSSSAPPPITPLDLTLSIQLPPSSSLAQPDLEASLAQRYGKLAGVLVAPGKHKDGKKPKGPRAVVEFAPGNWGGCWACMHDLSTGKGIVDGAKAKWATGTEPAWVKWAELLNAKSNGTTSAPPTMPASSPAPAPSFTSAPAFGSAPAFASAPEFGSAPDFSGAADPMAAHDDKRQRREREKAQEEAHESATLLRMRQRERERLAEEIRKQEAEEDDEA